MERVSIPKAASTVLVASKLPNSHLLQLHQMVEVPEASPTGTRDVKKAVKLGDPVEIKGWRAPYGQVPAHPVIPEGYALTRVDREFWEAWLAQNKDADYIINGIIFAYDSIDRVEGRAKENAAVKTKQHPNGIRSGLEPVNPHKLKDDPRLAGIGKITSYAQDKAG